MFKRICPKCLARWHSSDSGDAPWICEVCKSEIPKSQEVPIEKQDSNIRVLPRVCVKCKDLILPPFADAQCNNSVCWCNKCKAEMVAKV